MKFSPAVLDAFPGIHVCEGEIGSVRILPESPGLEALTQETIRSVRSRHTLEQVKDDPVFRAYRSFFWSVGVDPTKTRPASEALVRRILAGKPFPRISTAVDAYNLASASSGVPIAAFDADTLRGDLGLRFACDDEHFLGIGMERPIVLAKNQVVMTDGSRIIAVYPYRDSDTTKVTAGTRNIRIVTCGVPGIEPCLLTGAFDRCASYLERYSGGIRGQSGVFPAP